MQKLDRHDGTIDVLALSSNGQFIATGGTRLPLSLVSTDCVPKATMDSNFFRQITSARYLLLPSTACMRLRL